MLLNSLMTLAGGAAVLMSASAFSQAAELKLSGAAATANTIINPYKAALEKETGIALNITVNGDGNGVKDLHAGKVDVAMIAAPLKATEAVLNKATPGAVSVDGFELATIGSTSIKFVVHPANPVKSLTEAQLKDIFAGKISSWKDVGGADEPILVVAEARGLARAPISLHRSAPKSATKPVSCRLFRWSAKSSVRCPPSAMATPV